MATSDLFDHNVRKVNFVLINGPEKFTGDVPFMGRFIGGSLNDGEIHHAVTVPALLLTLAYD